MTDDIVTRLRDRVAARPEFVPEGSVGHLIYEAADEIERLREFAKALYEETKRCGSKHDVIATWNWEEYEMDFLDD